MVVVSVVVGLVVWLVVGEESVQSLKAFDPGSTKAA